MARCGALNTNAYNNSSGQQQDLDISNVDIDDDPKSVAFIEKINEGKRIIPTIILS